MVIEIQDLGKSFYMTIVRADQSDFLHLLLLNYKL